MGRLTILTLAVLGAISIQTRSAEAQRYYPWCAWYDEWTYSCSYRTQAQCLATISGVGGFCKPNAYPPPGPQRPRRRYY